MVWMTFLIIAMLTPAKTFEVGSLVFSVATLCYPVTYLFSDVFAEVYGYALSRRIVWTGLICLVIMSLVLTGYTYVPPSASYTDNAAFITIFRGVPILVFAGICAYFIGEITNTFIVAKLKVLMDGDKMWLRLITSTLAGQTLDNLTAFSIAHYVGGFFAISELPMLIFTTVAFCTVWEIIMLPVTYRIINNLKRLEGVDAYDRQTNFNPFAVT